MLVDTNKTVHCQFIVSLGPINITNRDVTFDRSNLSVNVEIKIN